MQILVLDQVAVLQAGQHGDNLPGAQVGEQQQQHCTRQHYHDDEVVRDALYLRLPIGLERHLLPVVDEAIVLMLIRAGVPSLQALLASVGHLQSELGYHGDIDVGVPREAFLEIGFLHNK